jgi:hypothetical protein
MRIPMIAITIKSSMRVKLARCREEGALEERVETGSLVLDRTGNGISDVAPMEKFSSRGRQPRQGLGHARWVLYEIVHGKSKKNSPVFHLRSTQFSHSLLPATIRPD